MVLDDDIVELANFIKNNNFANSSVLVSGSTGLLGSLLVKGFLKADEIYDLNTKVYALVRNVEKAKNIFSDFENNEYLKIVQNEITETININENIDYVFHTACVTASKEMITHPVEIINTSVNGTLNILNFAKNHGAKSVIYFSSMEVFGVCNDTDKRLTENDLGNLDLTSLRSCYPESKRLCENLCKCYAEEYGLNVCIARLTQTFGAGVSLEDNRIFAYIAKSVINNEDIILKSSGNLVRDYVYTIDALKGVLLISKFGKKGEIFNIANENTTISVKDMAQKVLNNFIPGQKLKFDLSQTNSFGFSPPSQTKLDTSKIQSLGWTPKYDLKEMYKRLIQYYNEIKR